MNLCSTKQKQRGVTLIELVISIVVLSFAIVAMLNAFSISISHSADPLWRNKSLKLAQLYLDEILAKKYDESTPLGGVPAVISPDCSSGYLGADTGETRDIFNDVDDYDDLTDSPPKDIDGNSLGASYSAYSVSIEVVCDDGKVEASADIHAKKITVTVTPPGESPMTFAAYKGNY